MSKQPGLDLPVDTLPRGSSVPTGVSPAHLKALVLYSGSSNAGRNPERFQQAILDSRLQEELYLEVLS